MINEYFTLEDRDYIKKILLRRKDLLESVPYKVWGEETCLILEEIIYIKSIINRLM